MTRVDLIKTDEARVARICLAAGEISPAHFHSMVVEHIVCLRGEVGIQIDSSGDTKYLSPGQICEIAPQTRHHLVNPGDSESEILLVQKGAYDFVTVNS